MHDAVSEQVRVRIGREQYALPVDHVLEVAVAVELTPLPGASREILGIRNLRGQILPVLDLALILGMESLERPERVVVAEDAGRRTGLAVDEVVEVGPLPAATESAKSEYLHSAAFVDGSLVGMIDVPAVLDSVEGGT